MTKPVLTGEMTHVALAEYESLPMFGVSDELAPRIAELGLEDNVRELAENGYTVFRSAMPEAFIDRLRATIRAAVVDRRGTYFGIFENGGTCDMLLERDDVFAEAVTNPRLLAIAEYMCGRGMLISQVIGSLRSEGAKGLQIHCDQDWIPSPFPEHNALITACWYCDDIPFTAAGGTKVMPGTHLLRRQPSPDEAAAEAGAVPILCEKGDIAVWDGRLWHGSYGRTLLGERILLHTAFTRLAYRTLEDYMPVADRLIDQYGPAMADLLGKNLCFGNRAFNAGGMDMANYQTTYRNSRR